MASATVTAELFPGTVSAYNGVEITSAVDLSRHREYIDLSSDLRISTALEEQAAWLTGLWSAVPRVAIEIRYRSDPERRTLRCFALARVDIDAGIAVEPQAERWLQRLLDVPPHVNARPLDGDELKDALWGLGPGSDPHALAEVRKLVVDAPVNRRDGATYGLHRYIAIVPWAEVPVSWDPLYRALSNAAAPVVVSVGLGPYQPSEALAHFLASASSLYDRFGVEVTDPGAASVYTGGGQLLGEPFARDAARLFLRAQRRYRDHPFRSRVLAFSTEPLPPGLLAVLGRTIGPPARRTGTFLEDTAGAAYEVFRPLEAVERRAAVDNAMNLRHQPWGDEDRLEVAWDSGAGALADVPGHLRLLRVLVDATEATAAARLPIAVFGSVPGFRVDPPTLGTRTFGVSDDDQQVRLGYQIIAGRTSDEEVSVPRDQLTQHVLIAGTTGSGKTNAVLHLLTQLWDAGQKSRTPFLVIEPVNTDRDDYRWLMDRYEDLVVLTVADENTAPMRLNPFEIPPGVLIRTHIANLMACFDAAFGLWDPLPHIYQRALNEVYASGGFVLSDVAKESDRGNWPTMAGFVAALREEVAQLHYAGDVASNIEAASILRAESLMYGACGEMLDVQSSYPMEELLARPVVVELGRLGANLNEQAFAMALILNSMTEHYMVTRHSDDLQHVTVIEEAHRLLSGDSGKGDPMKGDARKKAAETFAQTLAENRKYGEAVVVVEQIPSKLVVDAVKNTNLKVVMRLPGRDDREEIGSTMDFVDDHVMLASRLPQHEALVRHPNLESVAQVRIPNVRAGATRVLPDSKRVRDRFNTFQREALGDSLKPFKRCEGCTSVCSHRALAFSLCQARVNRSHFAAAAKSYPSGNSPDLAAWWTDVGRVIDDARRRAGRNDLDVDEMQDACIFIHFWHAVREREPKARFCADIRSGALRQ